jgi:hypothetical protein
LYLRFTAQLKRERGEREEGEKGRRKRKRKGKRRRVERMICGGAGLSYSS